MAFDELFTDTVTLIKKDGTIVENIKASVQAKEIFIQGHEPLIESGDHVYRKMSNGTEETYEILDPGFHEKFYDIPAGYQMDVRKLGVPEGRFSRQGVTYNITGNNARLNQNSVDNSVNVVRSSAHVVETIDALRQEIVRLVEDETRQSDALEVVDAIEHQFKSDSPKKSVIRALVQALPTAASITSLCSSLLKIFN